MTKRSIVPLPFADICFVEPPTVRPELTWMSPTDLLVDEAYQRGIGERGLRLIRRICADFDWRKFKPPTAVWTDDGLEVIDGQHSAIAAATHPNIVEIPVIVVDAEHIADRASAFLGMNKDRLAITPMALHAAAVVAGDPAAAAVERVATACGVKVLRMPPSGARYRVRETVAVRALADLIKRVGEPMAIEVMQVLAKADLAPVTGAALRAAEAILCDAEFINMGVVRPADLTLAIVALGADADREAALFAATHNVPRWRGLAAAWFKKTRKRKPAASLPSPGGSTTADACDNAVQ